MPRIASRYVGTGAAVPRDIEELARRTVEPPWPIRFEGAIRAVVRRELTPLAGANATTDGLGSAQSRGGVEDGQPG